MRKQIGKKGFELSINTIITMILILIAIAVFLVFYSQINYTTTVDKEACHQSVIFRATLPAFGGAKELVPLKCKTEKVCVTSKFFGSNCTDLQGAQGVTKASVSDIVDVEKTISQQILDCWTMMGEGKVSIFSQWFAERYGLGDVYSTCVVCSKIAFDRQSLVNSKIDLTNADVENYMMSRLITGKDVTYYDYISGEAGKTKVSESLFKDPNAVVDSSLANLQHDFATMGNDFKKMLLDKQKSGASLNPTEQAVLTKIQIIDSALQRRASKVNLTDEEKNLLQQYDQQGYNIALPSVDVTSQQNLAAGGQLAVVFMQITAPEQGKSIVNIGKDLLIAVTGISMATGTTGKLIGTKGEGELIGTGLRGLVQLCKIYPAGTALCGIIAAGVVALAGVQQVNTANARSTAAGYCGDVSAGDSARSGCSVVRAVQYTDADLSKFCDVVESIP